VAALRVAGGGATTRPLSAMVTSAAPSIGGGGASSVVKLLTTSVSSKKRHSGLGAGGGWDGRSAGNGTPQAVQNLALSRTMAWQEGQMAIV